MAARKQSAMQKMITNVTKTNGGLTRSVTGKMSANGRTAGGQAQTLGNGRGGKLTTRRKRYYDVRVGLGLAGG